MPNTNLILNLISSIFLFLIIIIVFKPYKKIKKMVKDNKIHQV